MTGFELALVIAAAVAAGINGGAFFAFSNFVMPALADLPAHDGVAAMQEINRKAPSILFVGVILGAAIIGLVAGALMVDRRAEAGFAYLAAAIALSVASVIITMGFNVPHNNALDRVDGADPVSQLSWSEYVRSWTRWNTLRTGTSLASVASFVAAAAAS